MVYAGVRETGNLKYFLLCVRNPFISLRTIELKRALIDRHSKTSFAVILIRTETFNFFFCFDDSRTREIILMLAKSFFDIVELLMDCSNGAKTVTHDQQINF